MGEQVRMIDFSADQLGELKGFGLEEKGIERIRLAVSLYRMEADKAPQIIGVDNDDDPAGRARVAEIERTINYLVSVQRAAINLCDAIDAMSEDARDAVELWSHVKGGSITSTMRELLSLRKPVDAAVASFTD